MHWHAIVNSSAHKPTYKLAIKDAHKSMRLHMHVYMRKTNIFLYNSLGSLSLATVGSFN